MARSTLKSKDDTCIDAVLDMTPQSRDMQNAPWISIGAWSMGDLDASAGWFNRTWQRTRESAVSYDN